MKALIIAAHGSRKNSSNEEIAALAERVGVKGQADFQWVDHAFLQFAEPLIETKLDELVAKGASQIVIFPLFIGSGSHVLTDIPELVEKAQEKYPDLQIKVTRHLGRIESVEDAILEEVRD